VNLLVLLVVGVAGFAVARSANALAGQVCSIFIAQGVLVAAVSWFQMRLEESERLEKLEFEELAKMHSGSALFEAKDAEVFPVQRTREQFERFFVPVFTVVLCLIQAGGAYLLWRWLSRPATLVEIKQPTMTLALFGLFALVLFPLGKFSASMARLEDHRLLRPGASYLLLCAYLCFFVALGLVGVQADYSKADFYVAGALCVVLALMAAETLVNLVFEMYRPRVRGKVERPLYDSRLVGLLGQPEGLITTAAQALDYQFGFKVSETWFYRFFEKALFWLLLAQVAALVLSTSVVFIEAGEQGVLEHYGKLVRERTPLQPGAHLVWPWPIDKVHHFRTDQIQSFDVGSIPDPQSQYKNIVLWTAPHTTKEENFVVANRVSRSLASTNQAGMPIEVATNHTPPVSLITGSIPVQFQITNIMDWFYNNEDSPSLLQDLATREIVRYLVNVDMNELMSYGRLEAGRDLISRIQQAAEKHQMGARVISVGLQDIHPPVKVAPDYEKVIAALESKQAKILEAKAYEIRTNALAEAEAVSLVNQASADSITRQVTAQAGAALFTNQIPAFEAAPSVYAERKYLETFAQATAPARKYLLLMTNTHNVATFDLQDKIPYDILNLTPPSAKK